MAKYTNIEVVKNLYISELGIQFNSITSGSIPGIRFNELSGYWEYNNGNEHWLPIGAGKNDVFYVDQFPTEQPIEIGIYITEEGESKYYTGENWISLSLEAVTDLTQHTTDNKVIPTCKAVADYVTDTIEDYTKDFITSSVSELENFYNKNEVSSLINQKVAGAFKFCGVCAKAELNTKEKIVGNVWQISGLDDDGSTGAEYACNKELEWIKLGYTIDLSNYITSSVTNLTNFYNKTEIDELIPEIEQHIFTVDNIPEEIIPNSIYVLANTKQTYISDNNGILSSISYEIISDLSQHTTDTNTIPECKAVVDYVNNKCNNYILTGTIFNYNTDLSGKPDLSIYATKTDLLNKIEFNINDNIPTTNLSANTLYITPSGEVGVVINNELTNLSVKAITDLTQHIADDDTIPTCKAVVDYIGQFTSGDVQHIFYVNELPTKSNRVENSIYTISSTNQLFLVDDNKNEHSLSYEIVNNIDSTSTNAVIPGAKAVYDYVSSVTTNYITSSVTDLTNFYNKNEVSGLISGSIPTIISDLSQHTIDIDTIPACKAVVDYVSGVIEDLPVGDVQHIFYVNEIPQTKVNNSIYVLSGVNQTFITDNNNNIYNLSYEISNEITSTSTNDTIPGTKAVYDYVSGIIEDLPVGDVQHIFYVNELPIKSNRVENSIYTISSTNQSFLVDDNKNEYSLSYEIVEVIDSTSTNDNIPGAKAVYDYVSSAIADIDIPESDVQHIFYVNELPTKSNRVENSIYTISGTEQSFIIDNNKNEYPLSYEIISVIDSTSTNAVIPGAKAVRDYVSGVIANLPVGDVQHIFYVNELPQTTIANSIYVLSGNQTIMIDDNNTEHNLSYKIVETIDSSSTNDNVPGTKAVYDYVNSHSSSSSSKTYLEIQYGIDQQDCTWNNNTLIIEHGLNTQLPFVQIYITENNNYILTNIPYTIDKISHNIIIDCTGYENKLISVKIME